MGIIEALKGAYHAFDYEEMTAAEMTEKHQRECKLHHKDKLLYCPWCGGELKKASESASLDKPLSRTSEAKPCESPSRSKGDGSSNPAPEKPCGRCKHIHKNQDGYCHYVNQTDFCSCKGEPKEKEG